MLQSTELRNPQHKTPKTFMLKSKSRDSKLQGKMEMRKRQYKRRFWSCDKHGWCKWRKIYSRGSDPRITLTVSRTIVRNLLFIFCELGTSYYRTETRQKLQKEEGLMAWPRYLTNESLKNYHLLDPNVKTEWKNEYVSLFHTGIFL